MITAHTKVYGIDWSWNRESEIITCGQDGSVKIWDTNYPRVSQANIMTSSPTWKVRYTPFGDGFVTMPQKKDNHLSLWSRENLNFPVYSFVGHTDTPREFVFRVLNSNGGATSIFDRDTATAFEMIT